MGIVESSMSYIQNRYPEVGITQTQDCVIFRGRFCIEGRKGDFSIQIAPLLELYMPVNYPVSSPRIHDVDDFVKDYAHKFIDGDLCVGTAFDLQLVLINSLCISDYFDHFLVPYFISYEYWRKYKKDIYGSRGHGIDGVVESMQDFFGIPQDDLLLFERLITWASKQERFEHCIPVSLRAQYKIKYSDKISRIRRLGMPRLKAMYKLITWKKNETSFTLSQRQEIERMFGLVCS